MALRSTRRNPPHTSIIISHIASKARYMDLDGRVATKGVRDRGAEVPIEGQDGAIFELRESADHLCSSKRAEIISLRTALQHVT